MLMLILKGEGGREGGGRGEGAWEGGVSYPTFFIEFKISEQLHTGGPFSHFLDFVGRSEKEQGPYFNEQNVQGTITIKMPHI